MLSNYYQKHKEACEKLQKEACERYQNLSVEEKDKNANILMSNIEIFLTKKKKSINMVQCKK